MILSQGHYCYFDRATTAQSVKESVQWCVSEILHQGVQFDAIAATGVSGLVIAPIVAHLLGVPFVAVRKHDDESTHSDNCVEGCLPERYIIIDDFTESYETVERIKSTMCDHAIQCGYDAEETECVGYLLYQARRFEGL